MHSVGASILAVSLPKLVGISHGVELGKRCRRLFAMVGVPGAGHNDLMSNHAEKYFAAIKAFLLHLSASQQRPMQMLPPRVQCPVAAPMGLPPVGPWASIPSPVTSPQQMFSPVLSYGGEPFAPQVVSVLV